MCQLDSYLSWFLLNFGFKLIASNASWISVDGRQRGIGASENVEQQSMQGTDRNQWRQQSVEASSRFSSNQQRWCSWMETGWTTAGGHHTQSLDNENMETYPVIAEAENGWSVIMQSASGKCQETPKHWTGQKMLKYFSLRQPTSIASCLWLDEGERRAWGWVFNLWNICLFVCLFVVK